MNNSFRAIVVGITITGWLAGCTGDSPTGPDSDARSVAVGGPAFSLLQPPESDTLALGGIEMFGDCDPLLAIIECEEEDPGGTGFFGVTLTRNWLGCTNSSALNEDFDNDGFSDDCELAIAQLFRPRLMTTSTDSLLGRETYWAVDPTAAPGSKEVRIFYALAYYEDVDHIADSEFIYIDVESVSGSNLWATKRVFLSAHWHSFEINWGDRSDEVLIGNIGGWVDDILAARPEVWVAKGKHANYRSKSVCNQVIPLLYTDQCGHTIWDPFATILAQDVEVLASANLGSRGTHLIDCVQSRVWVFAYPGTECFWTGDRFRGWFINTAGKTEYEDPLGASGF